MGQSISNIPLTPREQVERFGTQACTVSFQAITNVVIARCSNWDGRLADQRLIDEAAQILINTRVFSPNEFDGIQIRWCPLSGAHGLAPDRGRIYLDVSLKEALPFDIATTLAHEMVHVRQYRELGTDRFKCIYSEQYAACRGCQDTRHPLEREAYEFEGRVRQHLQMVARNAARSPVQPAPRQPVVPPIPPAYVARACFTNYGWCPLRELGPIGANCVCYTPDGSYPGIAQ